jgi:hypothetical protein
MLLFLVSVPRYPEAVQWWTSVDFHLRVNVVVRVCEWLVIWPGQSSFANPSDSYIVYNFWKFISIPLQIFLFLTESRNTKHDPHRTETHSPVRYQCTFSKKCDLRRMRSAGFAKYCAARQLIFVWTIQAWYCPVFIHQTWFKTLLLFLCSLSVYLTIYVYVHIQVRVPIAAPADHHDGLVRWKQVHNL